MAKSLEQYMPDESRTHYRFMKYRIHKILLVCCSYDGYILEEDGHIESQINQEYLDLNMSNPPSFTRVSSTREALEALDPEAVLLLDNSAADMMRETYADMLVAIEDFDTAMLKPGLVAHVQGRRVLALDGFEAALTDKAAKQRMWAYIKQLTPAAAPL